MSQNGDLDHPSSDESLQPFSGRMLLGIYFESGHSLWLYDFESTPTDLGAYREFWVVDPDDTRTLYYDTEGAVAEVNPFHDWKRSVFAEMSWEWTTDHIDITVDASEGATITLEGVVGDSTMSRVLTLLQRSLPGPSTSGCSGDVQKPGSSGNSRRRPCASLPRRPHGSTARHSARSSRPTSRWLSAKSALSITRTCSLAICCWSITASNRTVLRHRTATAGVCIPLSSAASSAGQPSSSKNSGRREGFAVFQ